MTGPDYRALKPGDVVPLDRPLAELGGPIPPMWLPVLTMPQRDFAAVSHFRAQGMRAFAPERITRRHMHGRLREYRYPMVPGIVYACFERVPRWHVMRRRGLVRGVLSMGGVPCVLPWAVVQRLRGLPEALAEQEAAEIEAARVKAGDVARLLTTALAGYMVEVTDAREGRVWFRALAAEGLGDLWSGVVRASEVERVGGS